ncbi:hypothetical protein I1E95_04595 [Synechococcus sp. CBW1107]|nr:hypothetical protein I1E95_04595 [Synechococcus sp. CBW1107]CAK6692532.1 hypothetical protein BBFGKLBO_01254 [Synechococcus sp. CBW1107]
MLALLAGEAFLADRPWHEIWWGRMRLDLASGWQLQIAIERDQLGALLWARAADGRDWEFGCQRDDWTLGPDSRIVEPVALLELKHRQHLELRLREAICWPAPLLTPDQAIFCGLVEPEVRRGKGRHWRQRARPMAFWHHDAANSNRQQKP